MLRARQIRCPFNGETAVEDAAVFEIIRGEHVKSRLRSNDEGAAFAREIILIVTQRDRGIDGFARLQLDHLADRFTADDAKAFARFQRSHPAGLFRAVNALSEVTASFECTDELFYFRCGLVRQRRRQCHVGR